MSSVFQSLLSNQAIPENQIFSLPLLSIQHYIDGQGADTLVYGSHVMKYFAPTTLWPDAPGHVGEGRLPVLGPGAKKYQITSGLGMGPGGTDAWLNMVPCQFYSFVIKRTFGAAVGADAGVMRLSVQYKQTAGETPPYDSAAGATDTIDSFLGIWQLLGAGVALTWPAAAGAGSQRYSILISPNTATGSTIQNAALVMGPFVRFQLNWQLAAPAAGAYYNMSIWASSS